MDSCQDIAPLASKIHGVHSAQYQCLYGAPNRHTQSETFKSGESIVTGEIQLGCR